MSNRLITTRFIFFRQGWRCMRIWISFKQGKIVFRIVFSKVLTAIKSAWKFYEIKQCNTFEFETHVFGDRFHCRYQLKMNKQHCSSWKQLIFWFPPKFSGQYNLTLQQKRIIVQDRANERNRLQLTYVPPSLKASQ